MKELKNKFIGKGQVKGFIFTQIKKEDWGYIYEVDTGNQIHYEVFKRKQNKRFNCISYPKNNSFGVWAWTVGSRNDALERFEQIMIEYTTRQKRTSNL